MGNKTWPVEKMLQKLLLRIDHGSDKAKAVIDDFVPNRDWSELAGDEPPRDLVAFKTQFGFEFSGEREHGLIMGQAKNRKSRNAPIAGGANDAGKKLGPNAMMTLVVVDTERGFAFCRADPPVQFRGAAEKIAIEIAVDD